MKRVILAIFCFFIAVGIAFNADKHEYAGTKKCKICHKGEKNGMVFEKWQEGPHAKAYTALTEDAAKEAHANLGKEGDPHTDPACLKCHVTGYGEDSTLTANIVIEDGVTCESCHGAGGDYWKKSVMENREEAIANGLSAEPKTVCISCHNEESPTYKEFNIDEFWTKISHSRPAKVEE